MRLRTTFNDSASEAVRQSFRNRFKYNSVTGEISRLKKNKDRVYTRLSRKGYVESVYLVVDKIEYRCTYHRLCWFLYYDQIVPNDMQIDHKNNIKIHNRIDNLQLTTNKDNKKKSEMYSNNISGYKGVSYGYDKFNGKVYWYYTAAISMKPICLKIGRFKNAQLAAVFYDAAARYYYKDWALCNYPETEYVPTCELMELRKLKKNKEFILQLNKRLYGTTEVVIN